MLNGGQVLSVYRPVTPVVTTHPCSVSLALRWDRGCHGRSLKKAIGVYETDPGSGIWWIRFKINGMSRREKIGRRGDAIAAYRDRKTAILRGEKLPATLKNRGIKFSDIAQAAIDSC
jgi:hypothetical protein